LGLGDPQPAVDVDEALEAGLAAEAVRTADRLGGERGRVVRRVRADQHAHAGRSAPSFSRMIAADAEFACSLAG
jgi:hypothetical protein